MEMDIELDEKIDAYILGKMEDQDRRQFEAQMEGDQKLREQVELHKMIADGILQLEVRSIMKDVELKERSFKRSILYLAVAASVLILVTVMVWQPMKMPNGAIIAQYAYASPKGGDLEERMIQLEAFPDENLLLRGGECLFGDFRQEECHIVNSAMVAYADDNYMQVIKLLMPIKNLEKKSVEIALYLGIALIKEGKPNETIILLGKLSGEGEHILMDDINYYLGLAYLQNNNARQARRNLRRISETSFYYTDAKEILRKMKRF